MMRKAFFTLLAVAAMTAAQAQQKELVILHTNDTHSTIMPLSPNLADTAVAGRGYNFLTGKEPGKEHKKSV